ncbi:M20 metallopeptidase family protein [Nocardioides daejeonensis]|uniref:M20 metallopeptidase family protein n=1 Tax=Nocardioides daejeonensis TaxID=1046556 RepID=UPI000D743F2C|nr:M20 family metallopeptidase [Nocardioides daejeonensis]
MSESPVLRSAPDLRADAAQLLDDLVALRRDLHQHPEVGLDLPRTQQAVLEALAGLDLEITLGRSSTSIVAVLRGAEPGPTVLLRGDMDALPIVEQVELPYRANNGLMHACGHDLHAAGLVGAAHLLAARRDQIAGSVVFMFQPGEEGHDGAGHMLEEGVLEASGQAPEAAYAIHVGTGERGMFWTGVGPVLASSSTLRVALTGRGGHASTPSAALDPVPALAELVPAMQVVVTRAVNVSDPAVLTVTRLGAGDADNVIPDRAWLSGTLRTFSAATLDLLEERLAALVDGIAAAHGLSADFELERGYPATVNDEATTVRVEELIRAEFGAERHARIATPYMGSEDFSRVLERVPGCYIFLGAKPDHVAAGATYPHASDAEYDDAVLADQAALLALLAWQHVGADEPPPQR